MKNKIKVDENFIVELLKGYPDAERKIKQLEYELNSFVPLTGDDVIEAAVFPSTMREHISGGKISDKTGDIALSYSQQTVDLNDTVKNELAEELFLEKAKLDRITYYVSILPEEEALVVKLAYFEGCTLTKIVEQLDVSLDTVKARKNSAINRLAEMYNRIIR